MYNAQNLGVPKENSLTKGKPLRELISSSLSRDTFLYKFHGIRRTCYLLSHFLDSDSFEILHDFHEIQWHCNVQVKYRVRAGKFHGCTRREPTWAHLRPKEPVIVASTIISRILIQASQLGAACSRMLPRWKNISRGIPRRAEEKRERRRTRERKGRAAGDGEEEERWWRDEAQGHSAKNERREKEKCTMHNVRRKKERAEKVYARAHRDRRDKKMGRRWRRKKEVPKGTFVAEIVMRVFMARGLYDSGPPLVCPLLFVASSRVPRTKEPTWAP